MTDGVTNCLHQSNAGLLQVCIYAQNTALVIEGVEQGCQLIGIGCHMMYSAFAGCTGKQFRIFAQLFNQRQLFGSLQSIQLQLVQSYSLNACFGQLTGIDLNNEKTGVLPSTEWKRNRFKTPQQKKWVGGDTISVSNGSGYNSYTPLQIAHAVANLANNGVVMKPHLVKILEDGSTRARTLTVSKESYRIPLKRHAQCLRR